MVITWYGQGCFKIQSGETSFLIDQLDNQTGLTPPRFKTDFTISTLTPYPAPYEHQNMQAKIIGPGEYEIKGVEITGWPINGHAKNTGALRSVYRLKMEDCNLGFLGHLTHLPDAEILEELGQTDLLFIPAGGAPYIDVEDAGKLIKQISPKIVIGSFFKVPGLKVKVGGYEEFLKELGQKAEPLEKLVIKKKELPATMQAVILKI